MQHDKKTELGRATVPGGGIVVISHLQYDRNHPALGQDHEFVIEQHEGMTADSNVVFAAGFTDETDAFQFVNGHPEEPRRYTIGGQDIERVGLGIPDALIVKSSYQIKREASRAEADEPQPVNNWTFNDTVDTAALVADDRPQMTTAEEMDAEIERRVAERLSPNWRGAITE